MSYILLTRRRLSLGWILAISSVVAAVLSLNTLGPKYGHYLAVAARSRPLHRLNLSLFAAQPPMIQAHLLAALGAVILGSAMMMSRKGRTFHRVAGWVWVGLLTAVALSSLFIFDLNHGHWSFLHAFSGWVLIFLPLAVLAARRHHVAPHRALMMLIFYGSLLISGALAFLPGRLMWRLFFG